MTGPRSMCPDIISYQRIRLENDEKVLFIALAIFLLASCQQEQLPHEGVSGFDKLSATMEQLVISRTSMDEKNNVLWSEEDQIVAFFKTTRGHNVIFCC